MKRKISPTRIKFIRLLLSWIEIEKKGARIKVGTFLLVHHHKSLFFSGCRLRWSLKVVYISFGIGLAFENDTNSKVVITCGMA